MINATRGIEYMQNQPEENQNLTPTPDHTPPLPYEQTDLYQKPQYAQPAINTPGQPSYNATISPYEQVAYNYQQSRYSDDSFPPSNPLPLGQAIRQLPAQYWRVLSHPRAVTFRVEEGKAAWNIIWVQLISITIIRAIISTCGALIVLSLSTSLSKGILSSTVTTFSKNPPLTISLSLISLPLGFFVTDGVYFLLGKAFGGKGTFLRYSYCMLLIIAPINLINSVFGLVPTLNTVVSDLLGIYTLILLIFVNMAVHHLSGGKATLAVLMIFFIIIALAIIGGLLFFFSASMG
jgi:hypothetical protein